MAYEMKPDSGSLFKNEDRKTEKHANARGKALIGGVFYFVDAWTRTDANGGKWQSLAFKKMDKQPAQKPATSFDDMPDDCPF